MQSVLTARGLGYSYVKRKALSGVDLEVEAGRIVGLAGPNGSGKTTFLKLLGGFLKPSEGELTVLGHEPFREAPAMMKRVRFAFAPPALFDSLTAREHLRFLPAIGGAKPGEAEIEETLEAVGLRERSEERVRVFSFGMRQRLVLAQALLPRPELLVLDEPSDGLDPLAVLELRGLLLRLREEWGMTVLLSSHLMLELEELVDQLLVLEEGQTLFVGDPAALADRGRSIRLGVRNEEHCLETLRKAGLSAALRGEEIELPAGSADLARCHELLGESLTSFREHRPGLEQGLLNLLRERRAAKAVRP